MQRVLVRFGVLAAAVLTALSGVLAGAAGAASAELRIINSATDGSLLPQNYGNNSNDGIWMYAWNSASTADGDRWSVENSGGYYLIRNDKTGKCLKPGGQYYGKTALTQGECRHVPEFQWSLPSRSFGGNEYKIVSRSTEQVVAPYYGNALNEVVVLEPNSDQDKNWWLIDAA
ncbi:RICIN domain-containing protein [Saccharopolyspora sp. 6M]|uniref:RICIN domain-containing protein n=1 Tax=Saccharopolyspora sp. 6M TaxID=2877237 RepID=UPI001CD3E8AC|nr:RICIN domain-containing protein [Saccharopolyspora sp. 6M]MCA1227215.1 RICIN domain-containing protein [Saccharopolyspora sp. 6M]